MLPPRGLYRVEAITKSDDPDQPGWAYFLDLWTETGPARLHIEGELEESGERFTATLNDILPDPAPGPFNAESPPVGGPRPSEDQAALAGRERSEKVSPSAALAV